MQLTKSDFLTFLDSPLHLWLSVHSDTPPKPPSLYDQHIMQQGYAIEKLAKEFLQQKVAAQYPPGSTLSFEVTLGDGNYASRIDALVHDTTHDTYDLYEIKSSTTIHSEHKLDVTFQYLVAKASLNVRKVYLITANGEYRKTGEIDISQLFVVTDMSEYITKKEEQVYQQRLEAWDVLRLATEPTDEHCLKPKYCTYPDHCFANLPDYSIYELSKASEKQYRDLLALGIELIKDIPDTLVANDRQRRQIQSVRTGKPVIDHAGIAKALQKLTFPLYFLDYETYGEALPLHDGYTPYQQAVTQFSIHVARSAHSDEFEHYEYIATEPGDPSAKVASALCEIIGNTGTIIVWNKSFECGRNEELAALQPAFAQQLASINKRTYDLMEIFSQGLYVDYRFHGSASIKKVLPVLCPELGYSQLEIGEGTKAMLAWHEMVYGDGSAEEKAKIKRDLLTYCELDTWAMVGIWGRIKQFDQAIVSKNYQAGLNTKATVYP